MNEKLVIEALESWAQLNKLIPSMSEEEVLSALNIEKTHAKRKQTLLRLHRRYCMLRTTREREELMRKAGYWYRRQA